MRCSRSRRAATGSVEFETVNVVRGEDAKDCQIAEAIPIHVAPYGLVAGHWLAALRTNSGNMG